MGAAVGLDNGVEQSAGTDDIKGGADKMNNYLDIVDKVIANEGGYGNLYYADGHQTRAGITWKWNTPWWNSIGIHDPKDINREGIEPDIQEYYTKKLVDFKVHLFGENKLELAYQFYDHAINDGPPDATRILQAWLNSLMVEGAKPLSVDGAFGPNTARALSMTLARFEKWKLEETFKGARRNRYYKKYEQKLAAGDRQHAINCLVSWNRRVG